MLDDDEAMRRAVKAFYDGAGFDSVEKQTGKPTKYNKDYFDRHEKDIRKGLKKKERQDASA